MRLVIARCTVNYLGRLTSHLPEAVRVILMKSDGSVLIHSDGGSYKPLNWMSPPCSLRVEPAAGDGEEETWVVENRNGEQLRISVHELISDIVHDLGMDPGLQKDGVEANLQALLATHVGVLGDRWSLVRREYPTAIGPVDLLCKDGDGITVEVEIKRRGDMDGVEQLTRYLELLNRDPLLAPVKGVFAAQEIKPQARILAHDRGIRCLVLDYEELKGAADPTLRLF